MKPELEIPLKQRLNLETAQISWKELELFFAKGNLLCIDPKIDLINTAELLVANNKEKLEQLIAENQISFVTPQWIKHNCLPTTKLWSVVIAPYVICQLAE